MLEEGDPSDDLNADEATEIGNQRFGSLSLFDAPVFLPPGPMWARDVLEQARWQLQHTTNVETLLCGYIELLSRAKVVVDFWESNVGPTDDWPMSVLGESAEVEDYLYKRVEKLRTLVHYIEENSCS